MPARKNTGIKQEEFEGLNPLLLLKGLIASYIITIPAFLLFALILSNVDFPQRLVTPVVVIITVISVLTAGAVSTRGVRSRGWLNGSIVGLVYMLILYLFSSIVYKNFAVDRNVLTMTIIGVLSGAIGGIVSINTKKSPKYKYIDG
ncbi:MAG TPA: TIGR04086 family membrane protein [Clostridiales bacterium]|nr:TIGR04086 family membrane protein [Clostridiales bacterium]HPV02285.1 TIGR04086 family membrane protein [Clostridiales bacterium]